MRKYELYWLVLLEASGSGVTCVSSRGSDVKPFALLFLQLRCVSVDDGHVFPTSQRRAIGRLPAVSLLFLDLSRWEIYWATLFKLFSLNVKHLRAHCAALTVLRYTHTHSLRISMEMHVLYVSLPPLGRYGDGCLWILRSSLLHPEVDG